MQSNTISQDEGHLRLQPRGFRVRGSLRPPRLPLTRGFLRPAASSLRPPWLPRAHGSLRPAASADPWLSLTSGFLGPWLPRAPCLSAAPLPRCHTAALRGGTSVDCKKSDSKKSSPLCTNGCDRMWRCSPHSRGGAFRKNPRRKKEASDSPQKVTSASESPSLGRPECTSAFPEGPDQRQAQGYVKFPSRWVWKKVDV